MALPWSKPPPEVTGAKTRASFSSKYGSMLVNIMDTPVRIKVPVAIHEDREITTIPHHRDPSVREVEMNTIRHKYTFVRINYDRELGEYLYEVIEPDISEDEAVLLQILKKALTTTLNQAGPEVSDQDRLQILEEATHIILKEMEIDLNEMSLQRIIYYIQRDFVGYGAIDVMMRDPDVEDCSCDGVDIPIYIYHRRFGSIRSNIRFQSEAELDRFVTWLAQRCGKHISVANPMLDATMPEGSRLNATLSKHVTKRGSSFTIRRFRENPFTPVDMIRFKTMSTEMMAYVWICIEFGNSIMVCGGTASGKTTTLNASLLFIPPQMKIVSIEDTRELNLPHENWIPSVTRQAFGGEMGGEVDMFALLKAALRQRPQYMMVGEVRGAEAYVVFQAMATGHPSYSTFHAEDVPSMVHRMENEPINLPRALLTSLDVIMLQGQVKVGSKMARRVKSLTEIVGIDPDSGELITNTVFTWNPADDSFYYSGHSYIYEKARAIRNWSPREMEREVKRRIDILEYMRLSGVDNFRRVAKIVSAYYRDPQTVVKEIREKLKSLRTEALLKEDQVPTE
ncbi:MAG: type II/IV secretion system ATPase subunit [Candidatus Methanomethylophilaceae archaeon]|nr:type II/IV secretion system ATPase subunit [Candidatus Methanomethylophilaceae archaeon]